MQRLTFTGCLLLLLGMTQCTYVQVTDPALPPGKITTIIGHGGSLAPLTGPVEAEGDLCNGKPMQQLTIRTTAGQYIWNAFLGLFSSEYTIEYACAEGTSK